MTRVKILLATEATTGGAYKHMMQLATGLSRDFFEISVLLSPLRSESCLDDAKELEQLGIKCYFVPMRREISLLNDIKAFVTLYKHFKRSGNHIIHLHSSKAGFLGRFAAALANTPCVIYSPHCYYFEGKRNVSRFFYKALERLAARFTHFIVNISDGEGKVTLVETIIAKQQLAVIKNAIDLKNIQTKKRPDWVRDKYGIAPGSLVVTGVGRLSLQKDWVTFIKTADEVLKTQNNVIFMIVGEGECEPEIRDLVERLGLCGKVLLPGFVKNTEEVYGLSDIVLNTSLWEGISYVLLEAMSYEVPVVATGIQGNKDVVFDSVNGYLFPAGDFHRAADAVKKLIGDEALRNRLGAQGYKFVRSNHNLDVFVKKHELLYLNKKVDILRQYDKTMEEPATEYVHSQCL